MILCTHTDASLRVKMVPRLWVLLESQTAAVSLMVCWLLCVLGCVTSSSQFAADFEKRLLEEEAVTESLQRPDCWPRVDRTGTEPEEIPRWPSWNWNSKNITVTQNVYQPLRYQFVHIYIIFIYYKNMWILYFFSFKTFFFFKYIFIFLYIYMYGNYFFLFNAYIRKHI